MIENITHNKKNLALIIKNTYLKKKGVNFFTNNKLSQQVAFMSHKKGHLIQPHIHKKRLKKIYDTCEVLIILEGSIKVNFFSNNKKYLFNKILKTNDIIILLTGGHGFEILKNSKFIEVKQGPYNPTKDKFKF
jgi:cupin fold WbuC family metalloprotein